MTTFADNIIRPCSQKTRLWLAGTIVLAVLTFMLFPGAEELDASPAQAADAKLVLYERNCIWIPVEAPHDRLSREDLAKVVATYFPRKITTPAEITAAIGPTLERNRDLRCGNSESLCFKNGDRNLCLPLAR